jgi:hypothetical protein
MFAVYGERSLMTLKKDVIRSTNRHGLPRSSCPFCGSTFPDGNVQINDSTLSGALPSPDTEDSGLDGILEAFALYQATAANLSCRIEMLLKEK